MKNKLQLLLQIEQNEVWSAEIYTSVRIQIPIKSSEENEKLHVHRCWSVLKKQTAAGIKIPQMGFIKYHKKSGRN